MAYFCGINISLEQSGVYVVNGLECSYEKRRFPV